MPWGAAAAVAGAAISSQASSSASKAQQGAAGAANQLQEGQYTGTVERNQPYLQAGNDALGELQGKLPSLQASYDPNALAATPGYQFGLQQGQQALERSMAARGRSVSGAALKAASQFGIDYGTTKLNDAFSRDLAAKNQNFQQLDTLANLGQSSANNTAVAGQNYANQAGSNLWGAANSEGANDVSQGNIFKGLINQGASAYKSTGSSGGASTGAQMSTDTGMPIGTFADGGPVRVEPKIGTRTPLPGAGTAGGMSRDAILQALDQAHAQGQGQQRTGVATLPANPVTNPGAILASQMQQSGAYADGGPIRGPGGPRTDSIPALVSNGEHVFDAASVTALGDGDNEKGQALLNEMRSRIKAHTAGQKRMH